MASKFKLASEAIKHQGFLSKFPALVRMIRKSIKGDYKPDFKNMIVPGLAVIYLFSPLDIIPDFIPILGQLDDLAILAFALPKLLKEVDRFLQWERERKKIRTIVIDS